MKTVVWLTSGRRCRWTCMLNFTWLTIQVERESRGFHLFAQPSSPPTAASTAAQPTAHPLPLPLPHPHTHSHIMANTTTDIPGPLITWLSLLSTTVDSVQDAFHRLPGSPILVRYIKSSYQVGASRAEGSGGEHSNALVSSRRPERTLSIPLFLQTCSLSFSSGSARGC